MEDMIPLYKILPGQGELEFVSLVDKPAILEKGLAFRKEGNVLPETGESFESVTDYPKGISETAQRAVDYAEENGWGSCGTDVGKTRAHQLAKGEPISEDTIKRMYSFLARHKGQGADKGEYGDGCGRLMYDAWGGDAALSWSERYLQQLEMKFSADPIKGIIVGPAMIPDVIIPRYDKEMGAYAVQFSKETIEYFFEQFNEMTKEYKVNIDHTDKVVESAFVRANWLVEDKENDKMNFYGLSYPVGTWMMEVKVKDKEWFKDYVINKEKYGFSVEGAFALELEGKINKSKIKMKMEKIEQIKALMAELSPEEVSIIKDAIVEVAGDEIPADVVEDVTDTVEEVINELMPETEEEVVVDETPETEELAEEKDKEYYTKEEVDSKVEEMVNLLAELRNEMKPKQMEEDKEEELQFNRVDLMMNGVRNLAMSGVRFDI